MAYNRFKHERSIYNERLDLKKIVLEYPELRVYAVPVEKGSKRKKDALRALMKVLLKKDFNLDVIIPNGFLVPIVPQRLNYLLWIEDLLALLPKKTVSVTGIDIGTGPCAIFSLLGAKKNGWNFVSTETSDEAIHWAEKNIKANNLASNIKVIQVSKDSVLDEVLPTNGDCYDFCLCSPPFFESIKEIKRSSSGAKETLAATAKKDEILAEGSEVTFVKNMLKDSLIFKKQICFYTCTIKRSKSVLQILKELQTIKDISYTKTAFGHGNSILWAIVWTFLDSVDLQKLKRLKPPKANPPLLHKIPITDKGIKSLQQLSKILQNIFLELGYPFRVTKSGEKSAKIPITANKNTCSNQRRKRGEVLKDKELSMKDNLNSTTPIISETQCFTTNSESCHSSVDTVQNSNLKDVCLANTSLESIAENSASTESDYLKLEQSPKGLEIKETADPEGISIDTDVFQNSSISLQQVTEDLPESSRAQKLKIENVDCSEYIRLNLVPSSCSRPLNESQKRKRECEDLPEGSVAQKPKIEEDDQGNCSENQLTERKKNDSSVLFNKRKSVEETKIDRNLKDPQNDTWKSDSKSFFSTFKLSKVGNHFLLEMHDPPEANRESMHQMFQTVKNKLVVHC